jgi:hypothetical protein
MYISATGPPNTAMEPSARTCRWRAAAHRERWAENRRRNDMRLQAVVFDLFHTLTGPEAE